MSDYKPVGLFMLFFLFLLTVQCIVRPSKPVENFSSDRELRTRLRIIEERLSHQDVRIDRLNNLVFQYGLAE